MIWSRRTGCVQRGHNQLGTWCLHGLELHPRRWLQWLGGEPEWGYMLVQHVQPGDPSQFCERLQQNQLVSMWTYHAARNLLPRRSIMCLLLCGCHHQHKWEWAGTQLEHHYHDYDEDQDDLPSQPPQSPKQARAPQEPPPESQEPSSTCTTVPLQLRRCRMEDVRCQVFLMMGKDPLRAGAGTLDTGVSKVG